MNAVILQQTAIHLARQTRRWDRRLRLVTSLIWVPRGLIAGLLIGIALALAARLRPWLMPDQVAFGAALAVTLSVLVTLAAVWGWPRSEAHNARFFDLLFDLKERVSTALELAGGLIPLPESLVERQLNDAVNAAGKVDVRGRLPFQVRFWEWASALVLGVLLIYLLSMPNPMSDRLRSDREFNSVINQQIQNLEQAIERIEANDSLTPEEREALTQPLEEAQQMLQQSDISQQEAVAAMAEAADQLNEMADGMSAEEEAAYQEAAQSLSQSQTTSDLAQAMQQPDLGQAADAMDELADQMQEEEFNQQERDELAEQMEQAADAVEQTNPALAEKMRETVEALRENDMEQAQEAAREAADLLREQEEALENSPAAQAAQEAQEQVEDSQRELAQAGQEGDQKQQAQPGEQAQQSSQEAQESEGQQPSDQAGEGTQPQPGQGEQSESAGAGEGETEEQSPAGEGSTGGQGDAEDAQSQGQQDLGGGSTEAGEGQGGAGSDTTTGEINQSGEQIETSNDNSTGGGIEDFNPVFESSTIGGESADTIDVGGRPPQSDDGETVGEGEFGPNPAGESTLSYTGVYNAYRDIVSNALVSGRIPLDQRDVIHDYFSSLDR